MKSDKKAKKDKKSQSLQTAAAPTRASSESSLYTKGNLTLGGLLSPRLKRNPIENTIEESSSDDKSISIVEGQPVTLSHDHQPKESCPCGKSVNCYKIDCRDCGQMWHVDCVSLNGLTQAMYNRLVDWLCPLCYVSPIATNPTQADKHEVCNVCRNTVTLQKANNDYEQLLCDTNHNKMKSFFESTNKELEKNKDLIKSLSDQLESISDKLRTQTCPPPPTSFVSDTDATPEKPPEEKPVIRYDTDFLDDCEADLIHTFLDKLRDDGKFVSHKGRETIAFGVPYQWSNIYNGESKHNPIPDELNVLMKKVDEMKVGLQKEYNSILINYYPPKKDAKGPLSSLASHADDEYAIDPDSAICTYSLGATRRVVFNEIHGQDIDSLEVESNSMYVMTKSSQSWYKHSIPDALADTGRYSVTIRQVNLDNTRGILVVGDSNTKKIDFGAGKGKFGERYPGKRVKAATIDDIDPSICNQHRNIAIMCGTNDLRPNGPTPDIPLLVKTLVSKVKQIRAINPKCVVMLIPVLPTRSEEMNKNVVAFNKLVHSWVKECGTSSVIMPGIYQFLDKDGLLATSLEREDHDGIHLGNRGISLLVSILKQNIYSNVDRRQQKPSRPRSAGSMKPA